VNRAAEIADIDEAVRHCRRRFADAFFTICVVAPAHRAIAEIKRGEDAVLRADIDRSVRDGGGRLDAFARFVSP
jgi:hypothetical protein